MPANTKAKNAVKNKKFINAFIFFIKGTIDVFLWLLRIVYLFLMTSLQLLLMPAKLLVFVIVSPFVKSDKLLQVFSSIMIFFSGAIKETLLTGVVALGTVIVPFVKKQPLEKPVKLNDLLRAWISALFPIATGKNLFYPLTSIMTENTVRETVQHYINLGNESVKNSKHEEAVGFYDQALKSLEQHYGYIGKKNQSLSYKKGYILLKMWGALFAGKYEYKRMTEIIDMAIKCFSNNQQSASQLQMVAQCYFNKSTLEKDAKEYDKADDCLQKALQYANEALKKLSNSNTIQSENSKSIVKNSSLIMYIHMSAEIIKYKRDKYLEALKCFDLFFDHISTLKVKIKDDYYLKLIAEAEARANFYKGCAEFKLERYQNAKKSFETAKKGFGKKILMMILVPPSSNPPPKKQILVALNPVAPDPESLKVIVLINKLLSTKADYYLGCTQLKFKQYKKAKDFFETAKNSFDKLTNEMQLLPDSNSKEGDLTECKRFKTKCEKCIKKCIQFLPPEGEVIVIKEESKKEEKKLVKTEEIQQNQVQIIIPMSNYNSINII